MKKKTPVTKLIEFMREYGFSINEDIQIKATELLAEERENLTNAYSKIPVQEGGEWLFNQTFES